MDTTPHPTPPDAPLLSAAQWDILKRADKGRLTDADLADARAKGITDAGSVYLESIGYLEPVYNALGGRSWQITRKGRARLAEGQPDHHGDPPLLLYHENLHALVKRHGLCPPFKVVNRTTPFRSLLDGRDLCILTSSDVLFTDFFAALLNLVCEGWE